MLLRSCVITVVRQVNKNKHTYTKLSYRHHVGKEPLRALTIGQLLEETANKYPDRHAIISKHQNKRLTFREVLDEADKLAAGLKKLGLQKGDRFGVWAPNVIEWYIANFACARAGLLMVAINPAYQPQEMEYCINKVGIRGILCPLEIKSHKFYETICTVAPEIERCDPGKLKSLRVPSLETIIITDKDNIRGCMGYNAILSSATGEEIKSIKQNQHLISPDSSFNIQFTSGTTGKPKAAVCSHFTTVNNSYYVGKRSEFNEKHHTICVQVPFFHAFGIVITISAALNHGATLVVPSPIYSPDRNLEAIQDEKCSVIHGTPTMFVDLVNKQRKKNLKISPEIAVCGGSPCSKHLFEQMLNILNVKRVKSVYGLTETTAVVFQSLPGEDQQKGISTVGHIQDHLEVKVVDANNNIVPMGTPGEICIRGYVNMLGYWEDEVKTKETIGQDCWLKTGDQFILTEDGYGKVVGRIKEMIIRGGENIFPKEIEDFLIAHPDIIEVYVIGLPHERLGEEVCACIRLIDGAKLSSNDVRQYCKGKIADFKIPSKVEFVAAFPKTTSGKIQKFKLVQMYTNK